MEKDDRLEESSQLTKEWWLEMERNRPERRIIYILDRDVGHASKQ